jgi:hypothetical protein
VFTLPIRPRSSLIGSTDTAATVNPPTDTSKGTATRKTDNERAEGNTDASSSTSAASSSSTKFKASAKGGAGSEAQKPEAALEEEDLKKSAEVSGKA